MILENQNLIGTRASKRHVLVVETSPSSRSMISTSTFNVNFFNSYSPLFSAPRPRHAPAQIPQDCRFVALR